MPTFTGTSAIALTWSADGHCRGLLVRRKGGSCQLVSWWEGQSDTNRSVAETLAEALRELGPTESTVVVAGSEEIASGTIDLDMPDLRANELRNALAFELRRNAPVPDDKLAWAYRVVEDSGKGRQHVRLYYVRQSIWETWLNHVSGLTHSLDMVIPPAAVLDPVLAGRSAALGAGDNCFTFIPREGNRREAVAGAQGEPEDVFGLDSRPLAAEDLDPGPVGELPPERQRRFTACALLGMYGLSRTFSTDRASGFDLPYDLRPRRHRLSRLLAAALVIYTVAIALFGVVKLYQVRQTELDRLQNERAELESSIEGLTKRLKRDESEFIEDVRIEIAEFIKPSPTLAMALADITRRVGHSGWCTAFRWREGSISLQLRETEELEGLERTLEFSPVLGDVRQDAIKVRGSVIDRKVEMNARFDFENEQSRPPPLPGDADIDAEDDLGEDGPTDETDDDRAVDDEAQDEQSEGAEDAEQAGGYLTPPPPPPPINR